MSGDTDEVPGLDLGRLASYLAEHLPGGVAGPLHAELVPGGKSNLTYLVSDTRGSWIVRRPPLGHVLATAHDMGREHRVMTALAPTEVPVPATWLLCEDPDVVGAPFYVMERVAGTPYRRAAELAPLGAARTRTVCERMVDTLATLHRVEPAEVGLADFGRPEGFLQRQVRRWNKQLDGSHSRDLAGAEELHGLLRRRLPAGSAAGVVHGDFRLDNLLVDPQDRVAAVIDWEMATLGDPLTDVALLLVYQGRNRSQQVPAVSDVSAAPGYLADEEMLERYAAGSGRDLSAMGFYRGLAYYKLAAILEGIHYRHVHGQTVGEGFEGVGAGVEPLIAAGIAAVRNG